ncbi:MAG: DNA polymerase III subunit delta [Lachnospiraceae bacterium]|nr:DNA polymerase III subunit delta [Lachnospiraceae bacterium]
MKHLKDNIATETFERSYLLYGPETYLRSIYARDLCNAILPKSDSMNRTLYEGKDIREGEIIDQAETMPMFAERRLLVIRDSGFFKSGAEKMASYMSEVPDYATLVFVENEVDKRSRLYKAVQKHGYVVEFTNRTEKELEKWAGGMMMRAGRQIRQDDMAYFLSRTGQDMGHIALEIDKLVAYTEGRDVITREDIEALTGREIENKIFDMVSAVAAGNGQKALALYADLLQLKEAPMRILILIGRQFKQMTEIAKMKKEGLGEGEMAKVIGMPPFAVKRLAGVVRTMPEKDLVALTERCLQAEEDVKNGRLPDRLSVELLLISLTG